MTQTDDTALHATSLICDEAKEETAITKNIVVCCKFCCGNNNLST